LKLVTYESRAQSRVGVIQKNQVVDVRRVIEFLKHGKVPRALSQSTGFSRAMRIVLGDSISTRDMIELLGCGEKWLKALSVVTNALARTVDPAAALRGLFTPLAKTRLLAPIPKPGKITCVGRNYAEHAREHGDEPPERPIFFLKSGNTICGPGDPIRLPPNSSEVDYEAEFAVVIGKRGSRIPEEQAYDYVAGYMVLNDVSARDMQNSDRQWYRGKSCDTFAPIGPWIVTRDEIKDPHNLRISLSLNGETMQDSNTSNLIFNVPYLVSYLSQSATWEVGDLISTGTPPGVGVFRTPQVFLKDGDTVSVTVEKLGTLTNPVVGP
jgi:acylpyruvate hydrolase